MLRALIVAAALSPAACMAAGAGDSADGFVPGYVYRGGVSSGEPAAPSDPVPSGQAAREVMGVLRASLGPPQRGPAGGYVSRRAPAEPEIAVVSGTAEALSASRVEIDGSQFSLGGVGDLDDAECSDAGGVGYDCADWGRRALAEILRRASTTCFVQVSGGDGGARCRTGEIDLSRWVVAAGVAPSDGLDVETRVLEEGARKSGRGVWSGSFRSPSRSWSPPS